MDPFTWVYLAIAVVSLYLSISNMPKPVNERPPSLSEFDFPQFEEGTDQAMIFGDVWCPDWMVLGYGDYRNTPIKASGGK
ncbi:MAG: hypothetical protein ACREO8_09220 [Luteimonas sp.]